MKNDAISRSALERIVQQSGQDAGLHFEDMQKFLRWLKKATALDVAPVVHGEFVRLPEEVIPCLHVDPVLCKTCNTTFFTFNKEGKRLMLCPYCGAQYSGARMDGEDDGK